MATVRWLRHEHQATRFRCSFGGGFFGPPNDPWEIQVRWATGFWRFATQNSPTKPFGTSKSSRIRPWLKQPWWLEDHPNLNPPDHPKTNAPRLVETFRLASHLDVGMRRFFRKPKKNGNWGNPPVSWRWFSKRNHLEMIFRLIFHQFNKRCSQIFPWVGGSCHLRTGMAQYGEKKPESGTNPITRVKTTCNTWDDPPSSDSSYHLVTSFPLFIEIFLHFSMFYWKCSSISHPFPHVLLGFLQIFLCFTGISHQFSQTFPCVSIKTLRFPSPHLPLLIPPLTMFTMFAMFASTRCRARHFFGTSWQGLRYLRSASRYLLTYKALISHI